MSKYKTIVDEHGVERFKQKPIMKWISRNINFNEMVVAYAQGAFSKEEFQKFYRDIGYSVEGYHDVWSDPN